MLDMGEYSIDVMCHQHDRATLDELATKALIHQPLGRVGVDGSQHIVEEQDRESESTLRAPAPPLAFWPPESETPFSPTSVRSPSGNVLRSGSKQAAAEHSVGIGLIKVLAKDDVVHGCSWSRAKPSGNNTPRRH
ncbi:hypothetical protein L1887_53512 [Cichorium endivia]|nr:hypothetical protein L1887_53512 [Cichorium endivia]